MRKAVFLDKDGTLIPDIPYNVDPDLITLSHNCVEGLKLLADAGYLFIIISNQSGVAKGYFKEADLGAVTNKLSDLFAGHGLELTDVYYCPHSPDGIVSAYTLDCNCRKPKPGMLERAAQAHQLDLGICWMIGDILNDVEAGNRAGCRTVLINNGNETEWLPGPYRTPDITCLTINEAATAINHYTKNNVGLEQS